jgi:alpha-glucosidase
MTVASALEATAPGRAALLAEPHHDGSGLCVLESPEQPGGEAVVALRVPRGTAVDTVVLRYLRDGEARAVRAEVDREASDATWWRASFPVTAPSVRYRWLLAGGDVGYAWVNGLGVVGHDVPDADDFVLAPAAGGPDWHLGSVVYEIFPDRFASARLALERPAWAVERPWGERPAGRGQGTQFEWFGGDLVGLEQRLDHVERLGASVLYLTPFFPARTTHRYDATSFDRVDPLLGGDEALDALVASAGARGMRVLGDLTVNHCGDGHEWFLAARNGAGAAEREFFWFDERLPNGYESWLGVRTLPKLDWRSAELRRRMLAVARSWVERGLAGWRIDVANMAGRRDAVDSNGELARAVRGAVEAARADGLVVAEHAHDFRPDLQGDGWHSVMNYAGFLKPVWAWLRGDHLPRALTDEFHAVPVGLQRLGGRAAVATMRAFRAGVPWPSALHSWTLVDSHDTARFRTVAGSRERQRVGVGLQMTSPGVPMVFAGDELGLEGEWGEDARRTMPWNEPGAWDAVLLEEYRRLIALRRSSDALARGGIRYAHVGDDAIAYLRESPRERVLCLAARAAHAPVRLPLAALGCRELEALHGGDAAIDGAHAVLPADGPAFHVWRLR